MFFEWMRWKTIETALRKWSQYGKPSVVHATARRKLEGSRTYARQPSTSARKQCTKRPVRKKGRLKTNANTVPNQSSLHLANERVRDVNSGDF
ncbi:hypothetical protein J6590_017425 [Homalodisca vitripennis]|nr:hypothetical protein J6590_017425 [Homalodisca vitripennis]